MNPIEEATNKAIEGGWRPHQEARFIVMPHGIDEEHWRMQIGDHFALDPLFWQSLGNAMVWVTQKERSTCPHCKTEWQSQWHRFIDRLAEGKKAEDLFAELLK